MAANLLYAYNRVVRQASNGVNALQGIEDLDWNKSGMVEKLGKEGLAT